MHVSPIEPSDRLTASNKRALILWVLAGIAGALFAHKFYFRAFPEASVNFKVSRSEALTHAKQFVGELGENINGYQSVIVFNVDDNAKTYLERELGLDQANRLMSSQLNIWYWDVRFFKPQQEEEFRVRVNPGGQTVGYEHKIEEAREGAVLDRNAAQDRAQDFLAGKLGVKLDEWELLPEVNSTKRPKRVDWSFTWEKRGFRAKDAPYRLQAIVQGDRPGGSEEFLKVPEAWERSYQQLRSTNILYNQIAIIPYFFLLGGALWVAISLTRRGQADWKSAIKLGVLVAALYFLMQMNQWDSLRASYDTHSSYASFVALQIAIALLTAAATALMVTLVFPGAEPLYRASQPARLRLAKAFNLRGLRSKEFFSSAVVGLSLAAAHIGFIVAFYMLGSRIGVWAPQDLNYSDAVNTSFPWIAGVAIGLMAATSEEFLFRLFAIPFIERITGSRILAVILPAFSWSFLHSAYPQEPGYIRGIEVGAIGIVAGIVMLRWGILATLIWHYTVDASLVGLLLIRSNSLYFKISGVIVGAAALAPLLFSGISYLTRGHFEPDEDLLNRAEPAPEVVFSRPAPSPGATTATPSRRYIALAPGMIVFLAVCLLLGGLLTWRIKPHAIGDYLRLSVDARSARTAADAILRRRGVDPRSYRHAAVFVDATDPVTNEFLRQRIGVAALNDIYANQVPGALWRVRYFRDSHPEEYAVIIKPDGSWHSLRHMLAEAAPGASLSKEEAQARAETFLREEKKLDLANWYVADSTSEKRPRRVDHTLVWEQNTSLDAPQLAADRAGAHAHARVEIQVLGDEVANYRTYIKIPDEWRRKQEEVTLFRTIVAFGIPALLLGGLAITVLILFLKNLRSNEVRAIPWRSIVRWSAWSFVGYILILAFGNRIPNLLNAYQTAIPFKTMLIGVGIGALLGAPFYWGGTALLLGIAWYFASRAFGEDRLPGWAGMPAAYYRDALWIALGGTAGFLGLSRLWQVVEAHWPTAHRATAASFGGNFDAIFPAAAILGSAMLRGLLWTGVVGLIASFVAAQIKKPWLRFMLFIGGALAMIGNSWGTPADFAKQFIANAIFLAILVLAIRYLMRLNILACLLVVAGLGLLNAAAELLPQPNLFYRTHGYFVVLMLALLVAWPILAWRTRSAETP
jgi:membrane protease YdiL (CAAX protease family)